MKKRIAALAMAAAMIMMTSVPALAQTATPSNKPIASPSNKPVTATPAPVAPKTGESDALLYGIGAAAVCGTAIVVSGKKIKKAN